ncbi:MAG: three-Cys-motif partner protein TcmP [Acidobacteria bacterium]|nr:three-Cys-motif partner protein TcmP [Acidobacteriota bacterium]
MNRSSKLKFDKIGYWSELKLDIVREYAKAYSTILSAQKNLFHLYIDAFAGAGIHVSKTTGTFVAGSPLNALYVEPPFREFHLIDLDGKKLDTLRELVGDRKDVHLYEGDCNEILLNQVFPKVKYENFRRGLCLLDPYGLHLNWEVIETAGKMKTLDMFLNFPTMDMNRNALWKDPDKADATAVSRMTAFWGDDSWRNIAYATDRNLFGFPEKELNEIVAEGFRQRLLKKAGFKYVPKPIPMRNSRGAIVYYLFFASHNSTASNIIEDIFKKYETRGVH